MSYLLSSIVSSNMYNVLFSYACILIGQGFICWYIFMGIHILVPPFREAKFCGVPSHIFDKSECAASKKWLRNTTLAAGKLFRPIKKCIQHCAAFILICLYDLTTDRCQLPWQHKRVHGNFLTKQCICNAMHKSRVWIGLFLYLKVEKSGRNPKGV
jgi:hypothetical protein